ncbi:four helix bundle protein [Sphingobacterium lactis]|uniref:four helix bundle protein n=1 Tax=Sphingobacterium lactis TaxID=797291 RepID=UPI003F7EF686
MHNIKEIKVWHKAIDLSAEIYKVLTEFPSDEKFGLSSQIKRSVVSIASNIAEGAGRNSDKEFIHFLGIANGSCFELLTQVIIATRLGLLDVERSQEVSFKIIEIQKMIYGFRQKLLREIKTNKKS